MPIDPISGGTWIAGNDAGLVLALQNLNPNPAELARSADLVSRGTVIPDLLSHSLVNEAVETLRARSFDRFDCFQLILLDSTGYAKIRWDRHLLAVDSIAVISGPLFFTTSSLGDEFVAEPRRKLFEMMFSVDDRWERQQDMFHRHYWPDCPHLSVCMKRSDAQTVSLTVITLELDSLTIAYFSGNPDQNPVPIVKQLALRSPALHR
jgi:hypothetical protein